MDMSLALAHHPKEPRFNTWHMFRKSLIRYRKEREYMVYLDKPTKVDWLPTDMVESAMSKGYHKPFAL